jgi:hypothetical protein
MSNSQLYNQLAHVDRASSIFQDHPGRNEIFNEIGELIIGAGLEDRVMLSLSHRHTKLLPHECIARRIEQEDGADILCSTIMPTSSVPNKRACVWIVDRSSGKPSFAPTEFTLESDVLHDTDLASSAKSILDEIAKRICRYELEGIVGISLISEFGRRVVKDVEQLLETIEIEPEFRQVVRRKYSAEIDELQTVETNWGFIKSGTGAFMVCRSECNIRCVMRSPGHASEHDWRHCIARYT